MECSEEELKSMGLKTLSNSNVGFDPDYKLEPLKGVMFMGLHAYYLGDDKMTPVREELRLIVNPDNLINPGFEDQLDGFVFDKVLENGSILYLKADK